MKIGVLGGTFNPIHNAHLAMAILARNELSLDSVLLMVAADPPHKTVDNGVSASHRLAMATLAAAGEENIFVSDLELMRSGKSYTSDTLAAIREMDEQTELYLLLGSDMLADLPSWHRPDKVMQLATIACVPRKGQQDSDQAAAEILRRKFGARILFLPAEAPAISSTQVRSRLEAALPVSEYLPPAVERYCYESGLYFPPDVRRIQEKLRKALPQKRFLHTMGVVLTVAELSARWGADPRKARLAALLHDCAKYLPKETLRTLSQDGTGAVAVWHAFAGATVAAEEYGVTDPEVLEAIRLHATGDANMSLLDQAVYLADLIEPGRDFPCVDACRAAVEEGPDEAMLFSLKRTEAYVKRTHGVFHPASRRAMAYFTARVESKKPADRAGKNHAVQ